MKATITHNSQIFHVDLSKPIDISMPLTNTDANPIAWYLDKPEINPVRVGDWIGKVSEGKSSTNFNNIAFGQDYNKPRMRLPGTGGIPDVTPTSNHIYLYVPRHSRVTFVSKCDFISGMGHVPERMHGSGVNYLVSDLGEFDWADGRMRLIRLFPSRLKSSNILLDKVIYILIHSNHQFLENGRIEKNLIAPLERDCDLVLIQ